MATLQQTTIQGFRREPIFQGSIHLLLSGTLENVGATWNNTLKKWTWETSSWHKSGTSNKVSGPRAEFNAPNSAISNSGTLVNGSIKGIAVSVFPSGSETGSIGLSSAISALKACDRLRLDLEVGKEVVESLTVDVLSKDAEDGYVFFEVDQPLQTPIPSASVYFKWSGSNYYGYSNHSGSGREIAISLYPYIPPVESNEYNPILNNVTASVQSTYARNVETFTLYNALIGGQIDNIYDGTDADWSSSISAHQYSLRLDGSGSAWNSSVDYVIKADAGGATGPYTLVPRLIEERLTGYAHIPDSFFSSIANASSRWLGAKNAEYHIYTGHKQEFTNKNLDVCREIIQQNVDKDILLAYEGSPLVFDTSGSSRQVTLRSLSGSLEGEIRSGSVTGELSGTVNGVLKGYVSDVDIPGERITYYSSSVYASDHVITLQNVTGYLRGVGTLAVAGSDVTASGLERFKGVLKSIYLESGSESPLNISASLVWNEASGNLSTWGTIYGSGSMAFTGSRPLSQTSTVIVSQIEQPTMAAISAFEPETSLVGSRVGLGTFVNPNLLYLKDADVHISVLDIESGSVQIVGGTEEIDISGTLGNNAESLSLHVFRGLVEARSGSYQSVNFDVEDKSTGVVLSVQTVDQSTTIVNSFDSYTSADTGISEIDGAAGFVLTNGMVNISSKGSNVYSSLITEDQVSESNPQLIGSGTFLARTVPSGSDGWVPKDWDMKSVRSDLLGTNPMPNGTALMVGTFGDFTLEGTRKNVQKFEYLRRFSQSASLERVTQTETVAAVEVLDGLRTGMMFAQAAKLRAENVTASQVLVPQTVPYARLGNKAYNSMMKASEYKVSGSTGSLWPTSSVGFDSYSSRGFDFYGVDTGSIDAFITQASKSIHTLEAELSRSVFEFKRSREGQYTYVYLEGSQTEWLEANIREFSGSYKRLSDSQEVDGTGILSGSFEKIWGRFGEGIITRGKLPTVKALDDTKSNTLAIAYPLAISNARYKQQGISGVVYGSFNYNGFLNGSYEGNLVEGTIEGPMVGSVGGIVETGSVQGGGVRLTGTSKGHFSSRLDGGQMIGEFQNLKVTGNQLTENLYLSGAIEGVENIPLEGTIDGQVESIMLPAQCEYILTASAITSGSKKVSLHVPEKGTITGVSEYAFEWSGSTTDGEVEMINVNLQGRSLDIKLTNAGLSGSVYIDGTFGEVDSNQDVLNTLLSGQFEMSGSETETLTDGVFLATSGSSFSGRISDVSISQSVSGQFDIDVSGSTYFSGYLTGHLDNMDGHVLVQGTVDIARGSSGNLVEGHDRPFFTIQVFSGSILPEDTTVEAVQNMAQSDMVMSNLGFAAGMALVPYSRIPMAPQDSEFLIVKSQEYVDNTITLPRIGDIIFTKQSGQARVVSSKIYCPDLHALLTVNDKGTVIQTAYLAQIQ